MITPTGIYLFASSVGVRRVGPGVTVDIVPYGESM